MVFNGDYASESSHMQHQIEIDFESFKHKFTRWLKGGKRKERLQFIVEREEKERKKRRKNVKIV